MNKSCLLLAIHSEEALVSFSDVLSIYRDVVLLTRLTASGQHQLWMNLPDPNGFPHLNCSSLISDKLHIIIAHRDIVETRMNLSQ